VRDFAPGNGLRRGAKRSDRQGNAKDVYAYAQRGAEPDIEREDGRITHL
jgi:hypothetical protein